MSHIFSSTYTRTPQIYSNRRIFSLSPLDVVHTWNIESNHYFCKLHFVSQLLFQKSAHASCTLACNCFSIQAISASQLYSRRWHLKVYTCSLQLHTAPAMVISPWSWSFWYSVNNIFIMKFSPTISWHIQSQVTRRKTLTHPWLQPGGHNGQPVLSWRELHSNCLLWHHITTTKSQVMHIFHSTWPYCA